MAVFVGVRGFLQCDEPQLAQLERIIRSPEVDYPYNEAWALPGRHYNWVHYVFYGADIHADSVEAMLDLLRTIARIPPSDDDNDHVTGLFHASHEIDGMSEWQIRDGRVHIGPADGRLRYLDE